MKEPPPKIKIYTKYYCGWCREVLDYLNKLGWPYEEREVARHSKYYDELVELTGQDRTPTAQVDGKWLVDFGTDELEEFLKKEGHLS